MHECVCVSDVPCWVYSCIDSTDVSVSDNSAPSKKCPKPVGTEAQLKLKAYTLMTDLTDLLTGPYPVHARCCQV